MEGGHNSPCLSPGLAAKPLWYVDRTRTEVTAVVLGSLSEMVSESQEGTAR